jgi:hypothetical protein
VASSAVQWKPVLSASIPQTRVAIPFRASSRNVPSCFHLLADAQHARWRYAGTSDLRVRGERGWLVVTRNSETIPMTDPPVHILRNSTVPQPLGRTTLVPFGGGAAESSPRTVHTWSRGGFDKAVSCESFASARDALFSDGFSMPFWYFRTGSRQCPD